MHQDQAVRVVLTFGKVATDAVEELRNEFFRHNPDASIQYDWIQGPHSAARGSETTQRLIAMRAQLDRIYGMYHEQKNGK